MTDRIGIAIVWLLAVAPACVPTAARTNARLEPGVGVALIAGTQLLLEGEDENGEATEAQAVTHVELDLEVARALDGGAGLAVQGKVPLNIFYSTLDLYYQLAPRTERSFIGVGAELGIAPGIYGAYTHYAGDRLFFTYTQRFLVSGSSAVLVNPQLAMGYSGASLELLIFGSFAYDTGDGIDVEIDLFSDTDHKDYRKRLALFGAAARF